MINHFYFLTFRLYIYRLYKCSSCDKYFNDKIELQSHSKVHEIPIWNASEINSTTENSTLSSEMQPVVNGHSSLNIIIDTDSAVSEKVLLDTVAEKEVMDRVEVSCYKNMKKKKKKKKK